MLTECKENYKRTSQLNIAVDYELQDLNGKLEKR